MDLAKAYVNEANPEHVAEEPAFKKKFRDHGIRFPQDFAIDHRRVKLPKLGWVKFKVSARSAKRRIEGEVKNVTVRRESGRWWISFQTVVEVEQPVHPSTTQVGVDLGVKVFAALSDGKTYSGANAYRRREIQLAKRQREMSRKVEFSQNYFKAKRKVARFHAKTANIRRDQLHKASHEISKNHALVAMEDLRIVNMTRSASGTVEQPGRNVAQKSGLNKAILDQGWGEFRRQVGYKLDWLGGHLVLVDPRNTSRTCFRCGFVSVDNRKTQEKFACVSCGHEDHADVNAARNVLSRAGWVPYACGGSQDLMKQETIELATAGPRIPRL